MHSSDLPYELVQPPVVCTLDGAVEALLLGRWQDRSLVLVAGAVDWVSSRTVQVDWAPWSAAVAANA